MRQAPTQIDLHVELMGDLVRVEVSDDPGLVREGMIGPDERGTARRIVDGLADRWGSHLDRDRTTTWFELPAGRAA